MTVSVIIPIWNSEKYIARCLDSLINQTYKDIEIICVINGSTDASAEICKSYQENNNIKVLFSEKGVGRARNLGLENATGEWFAFVDSDDWLEERYIEILLDNAVKSNCDISACAFSRDYTFKMGADAQDKILILRSSNLCVKNFICCDKMSMDGMIWNKLYRRELFEDIRFREDIKVNEDCLYTYEVASRCNNACISDARLYHWYQHKDSACHMQNQIDLSSADVFLELINKTKILNDYEIKRELMLNYVICVVRILFDKNNLRKSEKAVEAIKNCIHWRKDVWKRLAIKMKIKYLHLIFKYNTGVF